MDETRVPERPSEEEAFPGIEAEAPPDDNRPDYLRPDFLWNEILIWTPAESKIVSVLSTLWGILFLTVLSGPFLTVLFGPSVAIRSYSRILWDWVTGVFAIVAAYAAIRRGVPNLWRKGERPYRIAAVITLVVSIMLIVYGVFEVLRLLRIFV